MQRFPLRLVLAASATALGMALPASAQAPNVGFVFPPSGQVGTQPTVTLNGGNLQGATAILVSGAGVEAKLGDTSNGGALPVTLNISANANPGVREVRVVTPRGTSNAGRVWVGSYPILAEKEGNNSLAEAQKLTSLPIAVQGQVNGGEDVDNYSFEAAAGDTFVFDLAAYRMSSGLDGYLALYDSRGKILQSSLEGFERDPRMIHTFKTAGTYVIQVRDSMYRGGGNFVYSLTAGKLPAITGYSPMGGKRGQTVNVTLEGVNLGAMKTMPVQIPMEGDQVSVVATTPMGPSVNPITLTPSGFDELIEAEPNDAAAQATNVSTLPVVINGRIDKSGDVDLYRVKSATAQTLAFDVQGRRIGSRIDSYLRILDATGKEVQANDDAVGKDSRLVFGLQANTEYLVEVKSLDQRFGGEVFYRLEIDPPAGQDFSLTTTPDSVNLGAGGTALITVNVARQSGFGGAIPLKVDDLPAGVTASPATIPAGANTVQFTLTGGADVAPGTMTRPKIIGTGTIDNKPVERVAVGTETYLPPLAAAEQARQKPTEIYTMTIAPKPAYTLALDQTAVSVKRGQSVVIKVTAARQEGQNAAIALTVAGQPANVTPTPTNVAEKMTEGSVKIDVAANAPLVTQNVIISGKLGDNTQIAPALTLTITE